MISFTMPTGVGCDAHGFESRVDFTALVRELIIQARSAQAEWSMVPIPRRLTFVRKFRELLADRSQSICEVASRVQKRPPIEILTAEILPMIAACKFLEKEAWSILAPRRLGAAGLPFWLHGVAAEIQRDPYGVVLLIGPANYSLSLPGIQLLQAVVTGNAVLLKPGLGGTPSACALLQLLNAAGLDDGLVTLLPESIEVASEAVRAGVDKVLFTGTAVTGAKILADLAPHLVPATMELSGCDALLVREDGDLDLVVKSLHYSLNLNSGATCIAPHRLVVVESRADELERLLYEYFAWQPHWRLTGEVSRRILPALNNALSRGAGIISGAIEPDGSIIAPVILTGVSPDSQLLREDIFAPLIATLRVKDDEEAIRRINDCPYALGASIFTANETIARHISARLRVGFITINDVIVPAGDPRVPIGGRRRSGFGTTRGREGLLDLTVPKVISIRRGRFRPHLTVGREQDPAVFYAYLKLVHSRGFGSRWIAFAELARRIFQMKRIKRP